MGHAGQSGAQDRVDAGPVPRVHDVGPEGSKDPGHPEGVEAVGPMAVAHGHDAHSGRKPAGERTRLRWSYHALAQDRLEVGDEPDHDVLQASGAQRGNDLDDSWTRVSGRRTSSGDSRSGQAAHPAST